MPSSVPPHHAWRRRLPTRADSGLQVVTASPYALAIERVGAITLEDGEDSMLSAVIDADGGFAYFGTNTSPGRVVKVDLAAAAVR